jgi:hypothetical protein
MLFLSVSTSAISAWNSGELCTRCLNETFGIANLSQRTIPRSGARDRHPAVAMVRANRVDRAIAWHGYRSSDTGHSQTAGFHGNQSRRRHAARGGRGRPCNFAGWQKAALRRIGWRRIALVGAITRNYLEQRERCCRFGNREVATDWGTSSSKQVHRTSHSVHFTFDNVGGDHRQTGSPVRSSNFRKSVAL